ncbi:MAG: NAD(P)/FAD-dependent oxidoreductase [Microcystaceae cyanobacterium]
MAVDYDLVVIGGGSGGLVVASAAAQLQAKVALVEKARLGGDCLWYGCVPSKSLIHASRVAYQGKQGQPFGFYVNETNVHFQEVLSHVQKVIKTIEPHDSPERFEGLGVEVIFGNGQFTNSRTFTVNGRNLTARAFVISTGSRPAIPPIKGLEEVGYLTNEQIFSVTTQPKSLAVIGGGPIGCELGQGLHRLGVKVTLIASRNQLLPKEDSDASQVVEDQLKAEGINLIKNTRVTQVEMFEGQKKIYLGKDTLLVDEILLATGRTPNVGSLNLEKAGVEYNKKGLTVNNKLQTTNPRIYGCGDVIGGYQFTHVAAHEAVTVLTNALFFPFSKVNYRVIPWATFTDPELARVGLNETEAKQEYGEEMYVFKQPFSGVDRAQAEGATQGFSKIITRPNGEILGAQIVGTMAGELIHEIVLAMNYNLKVSALTGIHIYPTLSEVNSKAALQFKKEKYAQNKTLQTILASLFNLLRRYQ